MASISNTISSKKILDTLLNEINNRFQGTYAHSPSHSLVTTLANEAFGGLNRDFSKKRAKQKLLEFEKTIKKITVDKKPTDTKAIFLREGASRSALAASEAARFCLGISNSNSSSSTASVIKKEDASANSSSGVSSTTTTSSSEVPPTKEIDPILQNLIDSLVTNFKETLGEGYTDLTSLRCINADGEKIRMDLMQIPSAANFYEDAMAAVGQNVSKFPFHGGEIALEHFQKTLDNFAKEHPEIKGEKWQTVSHSRHHGQTKPEEKNDKVSKQGSTTT